MNLLIRENLLIWIWFCGQMDLGFVVIEAFVIEKPMMNSKLRANTNCEYKADFSLSRPLTLITIIYLFTRIGVRARAPTKEMILCFRPIVEY